MIELIGSGAFVLAGLGVTLIGAAIYAFGLLRVQSGTASTVTVCAGAGLMCMWGPTLMLLPLLELYCASNHC